MENRFSDGRKRGSDPFTVTEAVCTTGTQRRYETVMCLGNGYLGIRSAFCEPYPQQTRLTLIAGLYDRQPSEVEELAPVPDVTGLTLTADGKEIGPLCKGATDYSRSLDLKNGLLTYSYRYGPDGGEPRLSVTHRRFVSMKNRHLAVSETVVRAETPVALSATASIDARGTVNGTQHLFAEKCEALEDHLLRFSGRTVVSATPVFVGLRVRVFLNGKELSGVQRYSSARRWISSRIPADLRPGDELCVVRYALFYTGNDPELVAEDAATAERFAAREMDAVSRRSFSDLLDDSAREWGSVWDRCDVRVTCADPDENRKIRLALYHMVIMCPARDDRVSIAAKGLTGMGYAGHVFWDCEIFNLPFFVYTDPAAARDLCTYRYRTLDGARRKAEAHGFSGAMYPWESASATGDEQCPLYKGYSPDNTPRYILTGETEHHVACDVAYGVDAYARVTGDADFSERYGFEILFETADFWQSRLEYIAGKDRYEIRRVIGPDEYKENVDNDVYTNYLAAWNMRTALETAERLQTEAPALFARFDKTGGLTALTENIRRKLPKLYLPRPDGNGLIPQNDTYLSLREIDLKKYRESGINRLIQKDYSMAQIGTMMVSKQADLIQLAVLMPRLFDAETVRINFDFYEKHCLHDSSLSLSAYAVAAARTGDADRCRGFLLGALDTDFGETSTLCDDGIHAANCGGIWQTVVFGLAGVEVRGDVLCVDPRLPTAWNEMSIRLFWHDCRLEITVDRETVRVENRSAKPVRVSLGGRETLLAGESTVTDIVTDRSADRIKYREPQKTLCTPE